MESYMQWAETLFDIAEALETGKLSKEDVYLDEVIEAVREVYCVRYNKGDEFADLYGKLLEGSWNKRGMVNVISLLAHHVLCFDQDQKDISFMDDIIDKFFNTYFKLFNTYSKLGYYLNCEKIKSYHERHGYDSVVPFNGKGVIYSAITGNYDDVKEPEYINDNFDYILFTNNPNLTSKVWKIVLVENKEKLDNVKLARYIKIMGHEYLSEYDYSVWIDGKLKITGDLSEYIGKYKGREPMLCFNHYENDCIYIEKDVCIKLKKDIPEVVERQIERYRREGYPEHYGLTDTAIMVRELHDVRLQKVMETWWMEVLNGSKRDQLSFCYACWKNDFVYDTSDLYIYQNSYVNAYEHN